MSNDAEYFVDTVKTEEIAPRHSWAELSEQELISTKIALDNRLMQYRNTPNHAVLQQAVVELEELLKHRRSAKN